MSMKLNEGDFYLIKHSKEHTLEIIERLCFFDIFLIRTRRYFSDNYYLLIIILALVVPVFSVLFLILLKILKLLKFSIK